VGHNRRHRTVEEIENPVMDAQQSAVALNG